MPKKSKREKAWRKTEVIAIRMQAERIAEALENIAKNLFDLAEDSRKRMLQ